jgi:hypothetical protein
MMNRLHSKRGLLSKGTVDSSHKSGKGVCQRGSLQQNKDLPMRRASSSGVQLAFATWYGGKSSLMHSDDAFRVKVGQCSQEVWRSGIR